jgi:putative transposase
MPTITNEEQHKWLFSHRYKKYFTRPLLLLPTYSRWRKIAELLKLSRAGRGRLEWIIYWDSHQKDASLTARHFGISRKTFYKWQKRFDQNFLKGLEDESRTPKRKRSRQYTARQYDNVVQLRKQHIRYGKLKLLELYKRKHPGDMTISAWKVQCIIQASGLYYEPAKQARINQKRARSSAKKKITELKRKPLSGFLICLDTIVKYWQGQKRYILTAIDRHTKIAFAQMYRTHTSSSAQDFLHRLYFLLDGRITNIQTDNGSEFCKHFDAACTKLNLQHYWSRVHTPKDNAVCERFNRTLQDEFLALGNMTADTLEFNRRLTEWLIEYNFRRPHQALNYMPPINFSFKYHKVLPMYPSSTPPKKT